MKTITTENFNKEWVTFWDNLNKAGVAENFKEEKLKAQLNEAAGALSEDTGIAYKGALIVHINLFTSIAQRLAKMVGGTFSIEESSLLKVCTLMHLSKILMYVENDNSWEIEKRGLNFKFAELPGRLKFGERSILWATNKGIKLSAEEFEAIRCLDKEGEDKSGKYFDSILSTIVRQANELAYAIEKERWNKENQ